MKKILLGAAALSMLAAPAFAQSTQSQNVVVNGSVAPLCGLGNQSGGGTGGYTPTLSLGSLVDGNGQLRSISENIGFGNVWCNSKTVLTLGATKLTTQTLLSDPSSFVNELDLIVDSDTGEGGSIFPYFGTATQVRSGATITNNLGGDFETGIGKYQKARVRVALPTGTVGNDRPVAGAYTGSITLNVTAS
jgi:hypothetical protein